MVTCIEQLNFLNSTSECYLNSPLDVFQFYRFQYGIPDAAILGLFLGILVAAIYVWNRSLNILAILGIYCTTIVATTWINETAVQPAYQGILWIITLAIASLVVIMFLKVTRE